MPLQVAFEDDVAFNWYIGRPAVTYPFGRALVALPSRVARRALYDDSSPEPQSPAGGTAKLVLPTGWR